MRPGSDLGSGRLSRHHSLWWHCVKGIAAKRSNTLPMKRDDHASVRRWVAWVRRVCWIAVCMCIYVVDLPGSIRTMIRRSASVYPRTIARRICGVVVFRLCNRPYIYPRSAPRMDPRSSSSSYVQHPQGFTNLAHGCLGEWRPVGAGDWLATSAPAETSSSLP